MAARKGQKKNNLPMANRMIPGADFPEVNDAPYGLPVAAQLSILHRQGKKRFIIKDPRFPTGLYEFEGGKQEVYGQPAVRMIQRFSKSAQPRRFDWIAAALAKITEKWVTAQYNKNVENEFSRLKKTFR